MTTRIVGWIVRRGGYSWDDPNAPWLDKPEYAFYTDLSAVIRIMYHQIDWLTGKHEKMKTIKKLLISRARLYNGHDAFVYQLPCANNTFDFIHTPGWVEIIPVQVT